MENLRWEWEFELSCCQETSVRRSGSCHWLSSIVKQKNKYECFWMSNQRVELEAFWKGKKSKCVWISTARERERERWKKGKDFISDDMPYLGPKRPLAFWILKFLNRAQTSSSFPKFLLGHGPKALAHYCSQRLMLWPMSQETHSHQHYCRLLVSNYLVSEC